MNTERMFPILRPHGKADRDANWPTSIPWTLIGPHDLQAKRNHSQSLEQLARRGGLSPQEAIWVIKDHQWRGERGSNQEAVVELIALVEAHSK